jgi:hypothetical protein
MRRIVLVLALLSGCSFVFVSGPPPQHEQLPYFSCTESRVAPVLDTIFAVLQGANLILAASVDDEQWAENYNGDPPISRTSSIPLYAVATLLGVGGAYYGYTRTAACRDAKAQAMGRSNRNFGQPQTWPPPGPYAPGPQGPYAPPPQGPYAPPPQGPYAPQAPQAPGGPPGAPYPPTTTPYPQAPSTPPPAAPSPPPPNQNQASESSRLLPGRALREPLDAMGDRMQYGLLLSERAPSSPSDAMETGCIRSPGDQAARRMP